MQITFNQYIQNPMGRKNAVFTQTEVYRILYSKKLDKLIVREGGIFNYKLYTDKEDYYIHMKVPSEVIEKFYYDVVIRFYTDDPKVKERRDLDKYYVQFFSNDPAFVYTFAHAFRTNDMFIEILKDKMSKEAIKKRPKQTNPAEVVGYVKSIFFCYLIMENRSLFDKITYEVYGNKLKKKELLDNITHADIKIKDRQQKENEKRKDERKKKEKTKERKNQKYRNNTAHTSNTVNTVTRTKSSRTAKRSPIVNRSKSR